MFWMVGFVLLFSLLCNADTKVPCLIFSGKAETEHSIDLSKLNRITFGDNSMVISSSNDDAEPYIELLYSLYHHLEIGDAKPAGIEQLGDNVDSRIHFDFTSKILYLQTPSEKRFSIGIFNVGGQLVHIAEVYGGNGVTLGNLSTGVYVAVATDGNIKLNLKFIIN